MGNTGHDGHRLVHLRRYSCLAPSSKQSAHCLLERHLEKVPLVHKLPLPLLQLSSQAPQLTLILAQQGALVHVLIHTRQVADGLGAVGKLEGAQRL